MISLILFDWWQRIDLFTSEGEGDGIDIFLRSDHSTMRLPSRVETTSAPSVFIGHLDVFLDVDPASIFGRRMLLQKTTCILVHPARRPIRERLRAS